MIGQLWGGSRNRGEQETRDRTVRCKKGGRRRKRSTGGAKQAAEGYKL